MSPKIWWYLARSTGIVAWALAAASVIWGLMLSTRSTKGLAKPAWFLDLHRFLGALTIAFTGLHMGALVADSYVPFDLADLTIPFASRWKPLPVALGVIAMWAFVVVEVTSLAKRRMPQRLWAAIHLSSLGAYVLATAHFVTAGTERTNPLVLITVQAVSAVVLFLLLLRVLAHRKARPGARPTARAVPGRLEAASPAASGSPS